MIFKGYSKFAIVLIALSIVPFILIQAPAFARPSLDATPIGSDLMDPKYLNRNSCPDDPKNLVANGGFFGETHDTPYGPVVNGWEPFIMNGTPPQFRWVNNEGIFKSQSEQILSSNPFDAGLYQIVRNTQPNSFYWFRLGWAPAAKSFSGPNEPSSSVGVQVGYDPFGGTDPRSPNVTWGTPRFNDMKNLNRPELTLVFPARANSVTVFMRAIAKDAGGENRVWFNAVCMEARPELGSAPPLAPTATPVPPTNTPRPVVVRAPNTPTKIVQAPTNTPVPAEVRAPETPMPTEPPPSTATPRFARPDITPSSGGAIDLGLGVAAIAGLLLVGGAVVFFGIGIFWWMRMR